MVTAWVIVSSLFSAAPHYGVRWSDEITHADCRLVGDVEPDGAMADAGVRAGDCLRPTDGSDDMCSTMLSVSAGEQLTLARADGGVFTVVPVDCERANFAFDAQLTVDDDLVNGTETTRDTDLFVLLKNRKVANPASCSAQFAGHCSRPLAVSISPGLTGRKAGCFTAVNIDCGESTRRQAWLEFPSGHVILMSLQHNQSPPPELRCVRRSGDPIWFDCKGRLGRPDGGEFHDQPSTERDKH